MIITTFILVISGITVREIERSPHLRIEKSTVETNPILIPSHLFEGPNRFYKSKQTDFDWSISCYWRQASTHKQWNRKKLASIAYLKNQTLVKFLWHQRTNNRSNLFTWKKLIVLCGYNKRLFPFIYLLYGYEKYNFSSQINEK
jgi:hypothetical protein